MYCQHCGAQIPKDTRFCEQCGQAVAGAAKRPTDGRSSRTKRRWVIGGVFLLVLAGIGTAAFLLSRGPRAGDVMVSPIDGAEMVYIPAGEFLMGSSDADIAALVKQDPELRAEEFDDEQPQFRARLPGYWIDKCEVTVAQYRKFCRETGREMPDAPEWGWQDDHPVVSMSWHDAAAYAQWAGKRRPTEMEWEKAARGTDGREYPWGDEWDAGKCANSWNSRSGTKPVGSYPVGASPYGALDMAGNVQEWCADGYERDAYKRYAKGDLKPSASVAFMVLRGGSWKYGNPRNFRCATRYSTLLDIGYDDIGFRCARDASP